MPIDAEVSGSLAYRKNEVAILAGKAPEKYTRLLPYIPGDRIVEAGSAEGVLALLLAKAGKTVTAIEAREDRHNSALALARTWGVDGVSFINGRIEQNLAAFEGADTFVAVRAIYYWGEHLDDVFAAAAEHVPNVVLCGNGNRAARWRAGQPNANDRADNYYASHEAMAALLVRHGYTVVGGVVTGDPIVVGRR